MKGNGIPPIDFTEINNKISEANNTISNYWNKVYPVNSIYMSVNSTSPATLFGGTWVQLKDRFLLGAGDTYSNNSTGGSTQHSHNYALQFGGYYRSVSLESNPQGGLISYATDGTETVTTAVSVGSYTAPINNNATTSNKEVSMGHYRSTANTSYTSNLPPYLTVYIWKRTA